MEKLKQDSNTSDISNKSKRLYRMLWRWHFYAGVFAIPFVIILSITGALYLFKPQIDALHDAPYRNLTIDGELATPEQQIAAAVTAVPNAKFVAYELPREKTDAVNILLNESGEKIRAYVHPQRLSVLAIEHEEKRFLQIVHDIHGELLLGKAGSVFVELAASWAIVLVLTGLYLWWPRNAKGIAGILYPRLHFKGRLFWRDLHSVIGIWISFFVLFLLVSGLPWALVWGSAFKEFRQLTGTVAQQQDWVIAGRKNFVDMNAGEHAEHQQHHMEMNSDEHAARHQQISINAIVASAQQLNLVYPVLVSPPSSRSPGWSAKSNAQNRALRADAYFDAQTGELLNHQFFAQRHVIDRVVGIGVAAHEGQLFGWFNQLLGLLTTIGLVAISVSGFIMWRKRAPEGVLGAPPAMPESKIGFGFVLIILVAAVLIPLLGASLILIAVLEWCVFLRWQKARVWLGL
jgi:uncharacterized iron-regulated membrane protein